MGITAQNDRVTIHTNSILNGLLLRKFFRIMGLKFLIVLLVLVGILFAQSPAFGQTSTESNNMTIQTQGPAIQMTANTEGKLQTITIPEPELLFNLTPHFDAAGNLLNFGINLKPELSNFYQQVGPTADLKTVFVYPIFTQAAYGKNGFYDYYHGKCDTSCLTVDIPKPAGYYSASGIGSLTLTLLGYSFVTDVDVDKNPDILKQYDKVIVLHYEYVSK